MWITVFQRFCIIPILLSLNIASAQFCLFSFSGIPITSMSLRYSYMIFVIYMFSFSHGGQKGQQQSSTP